MAPRKDSSTISLAFEHGIHIPSRTMVLNGSVGKKMLRQVQIAKELIDGEGQTITVILTTFGGEVYSGLGIYDSLRSFKGIIKIIGEGFVMSMGSVILQAADDLESGGGRFLTRNTTLMLHMGQSSQGMDHPEQLVRAAKEDIRIRNLIAGIIAPKMGIGIPKFNQRFKFDVYFGAQEAVDEKLADGVI